MKRFLLLSMFVAPIALAQLGLRQGTGAAKQIRDLSCVSDGGLYCSRDAGSAIGGISCVGATATETGCVTPTAQTFAGTKTLSGDFRLIGHAHASLTACSSGVKGMWQTCTTHNAPVFCDGTNNIETLGSATGEQTLHAIAIDGIPGGNALFPFASFTLSASSQATITAISGGWGVGSGSGSLPIGLIHSGGTCLCAVDCDAPALRTPCTGSCSVSADAGVSAARGTSTCTLDPFIASGLTVEGTLP